MREEHIVVKKGEGRLLSNSSPANFYFDPLNMHGKSG